VSYVTPVPGVTSAQVADEVVAEITKLGGRAIANHSSVTDWAATKEAANPHTTLKPGHRADQEQRLGPPGSDRRRPGRLRRPGFRGSLLDGDDTVVLQATPHDLPRSRRRTGHGADSPRQRRFVIRPGSVHGDDRRRARRRVRDIQL
jgi:hypothetical protein